MGQSTPIKFGEKELSALNAKADALSRCGADDWQEALDWGVVDCSTLGTLEWRTATSPEFD